MKEDKLLQGELQEELQGELFAWEYARLAVLGTVGMLERSLQSIEELYADKTKKQQIVFAPVQRQLGRDFLAAFHFEPAIDVTIVRTPEREASVVTYSLDKEVSKKFLVDFVQRTGFVPYISLPRNFVEMTKSELILIEKSNYNMCTACAELLNVNDDKMFGAMRYANFLHMYNGVSFPESKRMAFRRFGLRENLF